MNIKTAHNRISSLFPITLTALRKAEHMGDVVSLTVVPGEGYHAEADAILDGAKGQLRSCVLVGWTADGNLYARQTDSDAETNMLLDLAKRTLIDGYFED